ncbi:FAS1-like dehydratase domain-containing protein [Microbacterium soli]|uniref:FAS1-like dehydratase domain-containing protein n=1 Tax=Microbacterium soli TaxID=446075 RepID=A0ABP7MZT7_9MICO
MATYISESMRAAVGRVIETSTSFPIDESDVRRWIVATYFPDAPPRHRWHGEGGHIDVPEEFNPFAWVLPAGLPMGSAGRDIDQIEHQLGIEGPGLEHGLNGGMEVHYGTRMRVGETISSTTTLDSYVEKQGRLGLMLLTRTKSEWWNGRDELVKTVYNTTIRY